ncbi:MAG TPA: tRNA (N(6)-L-threonylcarbamoyladenosine(37)-C(2))-methylthiotransferase [Candidatus Nanoarchaeia archaeon]|nr:tRNA (N(6)-L-threonylcarbamoyladenosine(37)-C(2))-methylthiotransferase [Candidatus Nanoarchaeia archaeon]
MQVHIKTYGCQANISDSETIAGLLKASGHSITNKASAADIIIINTCSVKNATQSKIISYIQEKLSQKQKLIIAGCLSKAINLRTRFPQLLAVIGTNSITKLPAILNNPKDEFSEKQESRITLPVIRKNKGIAIIPASQGCLNRCNFCSTKLSRGNLKSYSIKDIKKAFKQAVKDGCKTIYLTSQDNGCYGFDIKTSLPELLNALTQVPGDYKIRVGMMNPQHTKKILPELLKSYQSANIQKFTHIPVQSGSDKVLKEMNRHHSVADFKKIVSSFRKQYPKKQYPETTIATDIIVGYPTETEKDFQKTLSLIKKTKPEVLNISMFSSRPKTPASKLKQLPSEVIKARSKALTALYKSYRKL